MGRYAREPASANAAKSCKARGSNLRVHFKVSSSYSNFMNVVIVTLSFLEYL